MTEQTFTTAAEAAAAWWAEQIGSPTFRATDGESGPQDKRYGEMAGLMGSMLASQNPVSSEQGEKFAAALVPKIEELLGRVNWVSLSVDYGPDLELANAAEAAGISPSRFPWKTHMSITRDYVTASLGYRTPSRLIWTRPGWERPQCGSQRYDEVGDDWEARDEICSLLRFHEDDHGGWIADPRRCTVCDGTYTDHHGRSPKVKFDRDNPGSWHSWSAEVPS